LIYQVDSDIFHDDFFHKFTRFQMNYAMKCGTSHSH